MNKIIKEDLNQSANCEFLDFEKFKNSKILVTGVTGFIGKQIVCTLLYLNKIKKLNVKIFAFARNKNKIIEIFKDFLNDENLIFCIQDVKEEINIKEKIDFIIHSASPVNSKFYVEKPVETIQTIVNGTQKIIEFAKDNKTKSIVFLSSMEIYGVQNKEIKEEDYGYIELLNVRSSYIEGKRLAENLCVAYKTEFNLPVKIARLSQIYGAGVDFYDDRVLSQFVRSIIFKKDIVLNTHGKSVVTNCYISDAVNGIFLILLEGKDGEAYNVANSKNVFSIKEIAEFLAKKYQINLIFDIKNTKKYRPDSVLKLNTKKLENLGFKAIISLEEMFERAILSYEDILHEK